MHSSTRVDSFARHLRSVQPFVGELVAFISSRTGRVPAGTASARLCFAYFVPLRDLVFQNPCSRIPVDAASRRRLRRPGVASDRKRPYCGEMPNLLVLP